MVVGFVFFLISLSHNLAALFALVVHTVALDVVHAELAGFDLALAILAELGLFLLSCSHVHHLNF